MNHSTAMTTADYHAQHPNRPCPVALLIEEGYDIGDYNPHNVMAWMVSDENGFVCLAVGSHEQEALDWAVDNDLMDGLKMSEEDLAEYETEGWEDSFIRAGNASEAFWSENLHIIAVANTNDTLNY